ncbi:hypothetical protein [Rathayibacter sp. AY1E5]|uniref:hypothetical protein n=1 Tax=Rathayibacter sp. AY1E5 TaxID=2080553 RepID=UPI0021574FB8|nr:hypothetical protein [Rathayibacter sp. AY1E5]
MLHGDSTFGIPPVADSSANSLERRAHSQLTSTGDDDRLLQFVDRKAESAERHARLADLVVISEFDNSHLARVALLVADESGATDAVAPLEPVVASPAAPNAPNPRPASASASASASIFPVVGARPAA